VANLGSNFYPKLVELAGEVGMRPEDILCIMVSESGLNPQARNPNGGATGLVQVMPYVLKGLGFQGSPQDFGKLSGEEQLPYVKRLIQGAMKVNGGPFTSAAQYYVANFWPAGLKLPGVRRGDPSTPIVEENPATVGQYSKKYYDVGIKIPASYERAAYKANPLFHGTTPGAITYGDMINQTEKNKRNPLYIKALLAMQDQTGYTPGSQPPSIVARRSLMPSTPTHSYIDQILDEITQELSAVASDKKAIKKLPHHDILIQIDAPDYTSAVEFSRILCTALDEELQAFAYPHADGMRIVEVECRIAGPAKECFQAVQQLSQAIADTFKTATIKIGGIVIKTNCIMDKKSSYQQISLRTADTHYRKFLLKFI
jgi:hypothetical protein